VSGERVLIIDSDLQDPPELLPEMMRLMNEGADNVYGQRLSRKGVPVWKKWCYKTYYRPIFQHSNNSSFNKFLK
jgi:dolichol-phosphate mannosyltransferase